MPERLWAPWRFEYIRKVDSSAGDECIFVSLPAENEDRKNLILFRGRTAFVMLNTYPYTSGHLMVVPFRHTGDIEDLDDDELLEINQLVKRSIVWLKEAYKPQGFNIGVNVGKAAGAGIPDHLHWHVVPRWSGDTNYITTVGETRVLPHDLMESYDLLLGILQGGDLGT